MDDKIDDYDNYESERKEMYGDASMGKDVHTPEWGSPEGPQGSHGGSQEWNSGAGVGSAHKSAERIRQSVKESVAKGIAAAAGAVEGFSEEMEETHFTRTTKKALEQAGEVTREAAKAVKEEFLHTARSLKGESDAPSETSSRGAESESWNSLAPDRPADTRAEGVTNLDQDRAGMDSEEGDLSADHEAELDDDRKSGAI